VDHPRSRAGTPFGCREVALIEKVRRPERSAPRRWCCRAPVRGDTAAFAVGHASGAAPVRRTEAGRKTPYAGVRLSELRIAGDGLLEIVRRLAKRRPRAGSAYRPFRYRS
jgi:hypothetical protein